MDNLFERFRKSFEENIKPFAQPSIYNEVAPLLDESKKLLEDKKYEEAVGVFSKILKLDPDSSYALQSRATCYVSISRFEEALADINRLMALYGTNLAKIDLRAYIYQSLKLYRSAVADYNYLIESGYRKHEVTLYRQRASCAYHIDKTLAIHDSTYVIEMEEDRVQLKHDHGMFI